MVTTIVVHQSPHIIATPLYYIGGIATGLICHHLFGWPIIGCIIAGALWPEFWFCYAAYTCYKMGILDEILKK